MRDIKTVVILFLSQLSYTISFNVIPSFRKQSIAFFAAPRYGPTEATINEDPDEEQVAWEKKDTQRVAQQRMDFQNLINQVLSTTKTEHLPGLMTKNLELLLQMRGYEGVELMQTAIDEAREAHGEEGANQVMTAIDFMLSFTEEFVDQAKTMDNGNKELLGKIIRAMTDNKDRLSAREKEEHLDQIMNDEKEKFSTGFLKHIDGECDRIANAPTMTPESSRLLEIMRIIQTRVLEELGKVSVPCTTPTTATATVDVRTFNILYCVTLAILVFPTEGYR